LFLADFGEAMLSVEGDRGHAGAENPDFDPRGRLDTKHARKEKAGANSTSLPVRTDVESPKIGRFPSLGHDDAAYDILL
jgi:hypothetical protein